MGLFRKQKFVLNDVVAVNPLPDALTIFTDGSKIKSVYWTKSKYWVEFTDYSSIQQNELYAVIKVL